jgi:hypothetical protein
MLCGDVEVGRWPIPCPRRPDLADVEALARMQLAARRAGCSIELRGVSPDLSALLDLAGLPVEVCGKAEEREDARVEEGVQPDDPLA